MHGVAGCTRLISRSCMTATDQYQASDRATTHPAARPPDQPINNTAATLNPADGSRGRAA